MKYLVLIALSWAFFSWADVNPLLEMTKEPSSEQLQKWIDEGADVDEKNSEGLAPLIISAKNKWHRTVQILLDNKAHVNAVDKDGNTALHHTAYNNDFKTAEIILTHQALAHQGEHILTERILEILSRRFESDYVKINAYNKEYKTALMIAVQEGFLDYVKAFMPYKPNIEAHDTNTQTSLFYAVRNKDLNMVQYLIGQKANVKAKDKNNNMAIHFAIDLQFYSITEALAMDGNSPLDEASSEFLPPLHTSVMALDPKMIQILLRSRADIDNIQTGEHNKIPPLALLFILPDVSEDQMLEVAQLFIDRKASTNIISHSPIEKNTFLHIAIDKNYEKLADLLLSAKTRLNVFNAKGRSPLLSAIEQNKPNMVRKLLKAGANPNQRPSDIFYYFPLHLAVYYGFMEITDILLQEEASVKTKGANGNTALNRVFDIPIFQSHIKTDDDIAQIVQKLIDAKLDVNTRNNDGITPAMQAVTRNNFQALEILKNNGADFTLTDHLERTVYDHLEEVKHFNPKRDVSKSEKVLSDSKNSSDSSNCEKELTGPA